MSSEPDAQKDFRFTKWMIKNIGVLGIPPSVFFNETNASIMENCVRFCFYKKDENLKTAEALFTKWKNK